MERPLVAMGTAGKKATFWRLPWALICGDNRKNRFVFAPIAGSGDLLVADPRQFKDIVMHGPREDYMESPSWNGWTDWARDEGRGGGYMQPFQGAERLQELVVPMQRFLDSCGPEIDLIEHDGLRLEIRTMSIESFRDRIDSTRN